MKVVFKNEKHAKHQRDKMRILRIISTMNTSYGGPCQGIRNSIPSQAKLGVENEVVCFDSPNAMHSAEDSFTVHNVGPAKGPYSYCPKFKKWLQRNINRFDAIIIHGLWLYNSYGTYSFWFHLKEKGVKVPSLFLMPHGMLDPYFQGAKERRLKAIRNSIFWFLIEKKVVNGVDGLFFTCEEELVLARETFTPYAPKAELNVGYGIKIPPVFKQAFKKEFHSKCPDLKNNSYYLFLSRINPKKGLDILIRAYLKLQSRRKNIPHLVIAGPGLDTHYGLNIRLLGEHPSIHFTGMLKGDAKWGAIYGCNAFVLPSHQENFGIAIVEALGCGKPVLISDQVNIWREIKNGNGGLISNDNEEEVYKMLVDWIEIPSEEQAVYGTNAGVVFKNHFEIDKASLKMVETIKEKLKINS